MWNKLKNLFSTKGTPDAHASSEQSDDGMSVASKPFMDESGNKDLSATPLASAIKRAINEFGACILNETRFVNIVKDYSGFKEVPSAEIVIRTLIKSQAINRVNCIHEKKPHEITNILNLEISRSMNQYGFSEDVLKHVYVSIVYGLGGQIHFVKTDDPCFNSDKSECDENKPDLSGEQGKSSIGTASGDAVLDIRNIPFSLSYMALRNKLCNQLGGTKLQDYNIEGNKTACFKCNYNGKKNVECSVFSDRSDNKPTLLNIFYAKANNPAALKKPSKDAFHLLRTMYGSPAINFEGDFDAYLDYLNIWKENPIDDSFYYLNLQAFLLKEGSVICSFKYAPTEYAILIGLIPRQAENQDILSWRFQKPASFQLLPPMSPDDNSYSDDEEDYGSDSENNYEFRIAIQVSQIISDMLGLDINSIGPATDMAELCDWGLDFEELESELSIEMGVDVDFDDLVSCETLYDVVTLVIWHLDND